MRGYCPYPSRQGRSGLFVSDIFREIDEELRRDNLLKLWSRYGRYVAALAVLVLLAAGSIVAWRDHQLSERRAQSTRYASALSLARGGKDAEAAKVFAAIAQETGGYAALAAFEEAELLARSGDRQGAAAAYDRIAAASGLDPAFRELAVLLSVMRGVPEADPRATIDRLAPMTAAGDPWRPTALELTAIARLQSGDKSGALIYTRVLPMIRRAARPARPSGRNGRGTGLIGIRHRHMPSLPCPAPAPVAERCRVQLVWREEATLPGERISVLSLDRQLEPDPALAKIPITLPPPVVNADWPESGGYPNHAMQHLSLPDRLSQAWKTSIGEGASRYTRVLSQPVVAKGRVYAMDGGVQVSALDAGTGNRLWQVDLKPDDERGIRSAGCRLLERPSLCRDGLCAGFGARSGRWPGDWKAAVGAPVRSGRRSRMDGSLWSPSTTSLLCFRRGRQAFVESQRDPGNCEPSGEREPRGRRRSCRCGLFFRRALCPYSREWATVVVRQLFEYTQRQRRLEPRGYTGTAGPRPRPGLRGQP